MNNTSEVNNFHDDIQTTFRGISSMIKFSGMDWNQIMQTASYEEKCSIIASKLKKHTQNKDFPKLAEYWVELLRYTSFDTAPDYLISAAKEAKQFMGNFLGFIKE